MIWEHPEFRKPPDVLYSDITVVVDDYHNYFYILLLYLYKLEDSIDKYDLNYDQYQESWLKWSCFSIDSGQSIAYQHARLRS